VAAVTSALELIVEKGHQATAADFGKRLPKCCSKCLQLATAIVAML
jgi:hypothetical protein